MIHILYWIALLIMLGNLIYMFRINNKIRIELEKTLLECTELCEENIRVKQYNVGLFKRLCDLDSQIKPQRSNPK